MQGQHADVKVNGDRAHLFRYTQMGRRGEDANRHDTEHRRSPIQVVELEVRDGCPRMIGIRRYG